MKVHHDFESRSKVNLKKYGAYRYATDPSTEILMCAVSRDEPDAPVLLWVNPKYWTEDMDGSENAAAEELLAQATELWGHSVPFELAVAWGVARRGGASPFKRLPELEKYRCTAAMARKAGLPWALESLAETLRLVDGKDKRGKQLIELFSKPKKPTKKDPVGGFIRPQSRPSEWLEFGNYCRQDVRVEKAGHKKLKVFELAGAALATFQFDLRMNHRGIPINMDAARNAQKIIDHVLKEVTGEFKKLTGVNPTQRAKVKAWLAERGMILPNMRATTISDTLDLSLEEEDEIEKAEEAHLATAKTNRQEVIQALNLYRKVSYAAAKKIGVMLAATCPDGYMRGSMLYYGAGTGRWSGKILQPHNFKKTPKWLRPYVDQVYKLICGGVDAETLDQVYGDPMELIAGIIRCFIHDEFLDGDYSAVEARIICWLAGEIEILEKWRKGEDLYKWMASHVYGIAIEQVDDDQREVGKRIILGCGFQMGWRKFQSSCKIQYQLELPDELCKKGVKLFRALCKKIRDYWYYLNNQAKLAIGRPGHQTGPFIIRNVAGIPFLLFKLRSGRSLAYPYPELTMEKYTDEDDLDDNEVPKVKWREGITYWGQIPGSQKWGRIKLYGGKLAENETQATAADFMAHGGIEAEKRGMAPCMLVHDQGLAPRRNGKTKEEYRDALGSLPAWAAGFPMKVDVKITPYFLK